MNEYKVMVSGVDPFGIKFLKTVVELAQKGAVIDEDHPWTCKFPAKVFMKIKTDEYLETDIVNGVTVMPISIVYTKELLEDMPWEEFRETVRTGGVKGKDRQRMLREYLKNTGQPIFDMDKNLASQTEEMEKPEVSL